LKQTKIKRKQTLPPEAVLRQVPNFTRIRSDPDKPLLIYGSDDVSAAAADPGEVEHLS